MDNQDSSTGSVVPHGGSSREPERSSDSSTLGLELLSLLEPPPKLKLFPLKKSSLRLIALWLAGKVSSLQQKTEAGNDKPNTSSAPEHATKACFLILAYLWWLRRGTHKVAGNLMRPVLSSLPELPPLKMTIQAVETLTHQRLPA